jgi:hypothetical protein
LSGPPKIGWNVPRITGWSVGDFEALDVENTTLALLKTLAHMEWLR